MYTTIKTRKVQQPKLAKVQTKFQILQNEEVEENGIISRQIVFKTKKYERDKTISWKDFEIANLIAAGIDPKTLPSVQLPADIEKLTAKAAQAEIKLDQYEIIKEIEENENNEPTAEQTQQ